MIMITPARFYHVRLRPFPARQALLTYRPVYIHHHEPGVLAAHYPDVGLRPYSPPIFYFLRIIAGRLLPLHEPGMLAAAISITVWPATCTRAIWLNIVKRDHPPAQRSILKSRFSEKIQVSSPQLFSHRSQCPSQYGAPRSSSSGSGAIWQFPS